MFSKTARRTLLASLLLSTTAAPAMAQGLVEYALILVLVSTGTGGTVVQSIEVPAALERDCVLEADVAPLCEELAALEGAPSAEVMAELHRLGWMLESAVDAASRAGDANLDGEFSSGDLVAALSGHRAVLGRGATLAASRKGAARAGWTEGDWNADGVFTTGDLVTSSVGFGGLRTRAPKPAGALTPLGSNLASRFEFVDKRTNASSSPRGRNPSTGSPIAIPARWLAVDVIQSRLEAGEIDLVEGVRFSGAEAEDQALFVYSIGLEP